MLTFRKLAGFALVAGLALMAFASASASAAPELVLNGANKFPQSFTGESTRGSKLVTKGQSEISCEKLLIKGTLYSSKDLLQLLLWHGCSTLGGLAACQSTGEPSGSIHDATLVLPTLLLTHLPGLLAELDLSYNKAHAGEFECGGVNIVINGTVLANITSPAAGVFANEVKTNIEVETAGEKQKFKHPEGSNIEDSLMAASGTGTLEAATEEVFEAKIKFNVGVEVKFQG